MSKLDQPLPDMSRSNAVFSTNWHFSFLGCLIVESHRALRREFKEIQRDAALAVASQDKKVQLFSRAAVVDLIELRRQLSEGGEGSSLSVRLRLHEKALLELRQLHTYFRAGSYDRVAEWLRDAASQISCFLLGLDVDIHPWIFGAERDRAVIYELMASRFEAEKYLPLVKNGAD